MESGSGAACSAIGRAQTDSPVASSATKHGVGGPCSGAARSVPERRGTSAVNEMVEDSERVRRRERGARTRTAQTQMSLSPTTASPPAPGGSARRQATTTALQGQKTHRRRPPPWAAPHSHDPPPVPTIPARPNRSLKRVFAKKTSRGQRRWNWLSPVPAPLTFHYTH
jgi:hypothetical protein